MVRRHRIEVFPRRKFGSSLRQGKGAESCCLPLFLGLAFVFAPLLVLLIVAFFVFFFFLVLFLFFFLLFFLGSQASAVPNLEVMGA